MDKTSIIKNSREFNISSKKYLDFKKKISKYLNPYQVKKIEKSFNLACDAHKGQVRKSGEAYIHHPLSAASLLADFQLDHESIMAAILHDVIEDTEIGKENLKKSFGVKVAELVDGVSKLDKLSFSTKEEADAANLRKMILAMSQDIRVILIKLADRKHNLETIDALDSKKRKKIGKETLEIFAPIALRLGIHSLNKELEDLAFETVYPFRYATLRSMIQKSRGNRKELMEKIKNLIEKKLQDEGLNTSVVAREKHVYGLYKKMKLKEFKFSQINDLFGVRVISNTVDDCYRSLGIIHNLYTPVPGRFKDYIAIPKSNGYQSLHTSIIGPHGLPIEIQIRTKDMNILAESGIASHWFYKSKNIPSLKNYTKEQQWITNLLSIQKDSGNPKEYLKSIKADLHPGKVYVFTPKGNILDLPKRSTIIDYAYAVHTDLGNNYASSKVDDLPASPSTILKNGQRVEILVNKKFIPDPGWLNFVVTEKARHSIRAYLKSIKKNDAIALGKKLLDYSLKDFDIQLNDIPKKTLNIVLQEYSCETIDDLYAEIGLGNSIAKLVAMRIAPTDMPLKENSASNTDIQIRGTEGLVVSYAKCCYPIPGDPILGHISQEKGVVVHRQKCRSLNHMKKSSDETLDLSWADNVDDTFSASIKVEVENVRGVLAMISAQIAQNDFNIESVTYDDTKTTGHNIMVFVISINGVKELNKLIKKLKKNSNILNVERKRS
jgi:GTP diphosphokinase / guanosine-3',5'-bis(diphosphate) 3'-diphosphatase